MVTIKRYINSKFPLFSNVYHEIINISKYYWQYLFIMYRQKKVYRKICIIAKDNKRKLKVAFLVNENEKWCCQSLYDKLKESEHFDPIIFLTSLDNFKRKDLEEKYEKNIAFFNKYCDNVQVVYNNKNKEFYDLKKYSPDIVVYQQPSSINKKQNILAISSFALPIYLPYCFVEEYNKMIKSSSFKFHYLLFKKYISHELVKKEYINKGYKKDNLNVLGYPKLEQYLDDKKYEKKYIIYAPHHSVKDITIRLGTFDWNGKFILEYAKKHPEFNWIFKPHPLCKKSFIDAKIFKDINEVDAYYDEWYKIGKIYDKGNYIDLFKQTKCLITDCASFLIEFLPTESPVINLKRMDSMYISDITEKIIKSYYQVYNLEELKKAFYNILENNIDNKKQERLDLIKKLDLVRNASDNIIKDLENTFYKN